MPTTFRPWSLNSLASSFSPGIARTHGGHQVAQKSKTMTLPFRSDNFTSLPLMSLSVKSGAGLPDIATAGTSMSPPPDWMVAASRAPDGGAQANCSGLVVAPGVEVG